MKRLALGIRSRWDALSVANAVFLGVALGIAFGIVPRLAFGWRTEFFGFFAYFPFHIGLCYVAFGVLFSRERRARIMGAGKSPLGAFFGCFFARKYGLFCVSWFYTMGLYWMLVLGV